MFVDQKNFLSYLSDLVGLLIKFIDLLYHSFLQKCFLRRVNQGFSYIMHTSLYLSRWMTQLPSVIVISKLEIVNWN